MDTEKIDKPKRERPRFWRYGFTIANPFITDRVKVINIDELTEEQEQMPQIEYDYTYLESIPNWDNYIEYRWVEFSKNKVWNDYSTSYQAIAKRCFFKDYESAKEFFKLIDYIDYVCFKYEQGEETGHLHLQGFMRLKSQMDMSTANKCFPTMNLDDVSKKTNTYCREYCMKDHTAVEGYEFFEHGNFKHEKQRTDWVEIKEDIKNKLPFDLMFEKYPHLMIHNHKRIDEIQQRLLKEQYKNVEREIHLIYIWGNEGTGKSTYRTRVLGLLPMNIHIIGADDYDKSGKYDDYENQEYIQFDEFDSHLPITTMNDLCDGQPRTLKARYANKVAMYTTVIITSNYPLDHQWKDDRLNKGKEPSFKGFKRRVKEIIYVPKQNHYEWQHGRPSDEVIAKLTERGDYFKLLPQEITQTTFDESEVF